MPKGAKENLGMGEEGLVYNEEDEFNLKKLRKDALAEDEELDPVKEAEFEKERHARSMNA